MIEYAIEKIGFFGEWTLMVEEGLCNPYTDPDRAWGDYHYLKQKMGDKIRLVEKRKVKVLDGMEF